jgi:tellurite resistance protein TerC
MQLDTVGSPAMWAGFLVLVVLMLALDLGVFNRNPHAVSVKEAAIWSGVWVSLAIAFNVAVYYWFGTQRALEFTTAYLLEKALSVDNIFVFVVVFSAFAIPAKYQHRVLFWGVFGALIMRAAFIFAGSAFLQRFHWAMYVFGGVLIVTGIRLLLQKEQEVDPEKNLLVRAFKRFVPMTNDLASGHFTVLKEGRRYATPLLLALVSVEITDLVFAVDSIPAVFAITKDPFIVFTSNIFAILWLR